MPLRNILTIVIVAVVSLICYEKAAHNRFGFIVSHAMRIIEDNYIEEVQPRELFENAMRGMMSELDEYSDYIGPEYFQQFEQAIDQEFVGIGVVVEGPPEKDELRVVNPVFDSPAHRAGIRAGRLDPGDRRRVDQDDGTHRGGQTHEGAARHDRRRC